LYCTTAPARARSCTCSGGGGTGRWSGVIGGAVGAVRVVVDVPEAAADVELLGDDALAARERLGPRVAVDAEHEHLEAPRHKMMSIIYLRTCCQPHQVEMCKLPVFFSKEGDGVKLQRMLLASTGDCC
jgi:hypothetical protein